MKRDTKDMFQVIGGLLLIISGIILGLWLGLWVMFIGGIVGVIDALKVTPIEAMPIAINIIKIVCASFVGVIAGYCLIIPGFYLFSK